MSLETLTMSIWLPSRICFWLVRACRSQGEALVELSSWMAHRAREVQVRNTTKNQLLGST